MWEKIEDKCDQLWNNLVRCAVGLGGRHVDSTLLPMAALAAALTSRAAVLADLNYRSEITGAEDSDLANLLDKVSDLRTLEDKPPASEEALRRRADRDLGRLTDAGIVSAIETPNSLTSLTRRWSRQR